MSRECGGCNGLGSHWRWCPAVVGFVAHRRGIDSAEAEGLADRVGANNPGAANHLYVAAGMLREQAEQLRDEWQAANR